MQEYHRERMHHINLVKQTLTPAAAESSLLDLLKPVFVRLSFGSVCIRVDNSRRIFAIQIVVSTFLFDFHPPICPSFLPLVSSEIRGQRQTFYVRNGEAIAHTHTPIHT